ncbi:MAG: trypsin-like peptidase domain-containing protein [Bacteroidota bacterium]
MRQLTGPEIGKLSEAIRQGFSRPNFIMFLRFRLDKDFDSIVPSGSNYPFEVFRVIESANAEFWHDKLIDAFLAERPRFTAIQEIARDLEVSSSFVKGETGEVMNREGLESMVRSSQHVSMDTFSERTQLAERTVCSIRIKKTSGSTELGTGFLIGPDLIMSNYHVFDILLDNPQSIDNITCVFDYKKTFEGLKVGLHPTDPIVFSSSFVDMSECAKDLNSTWPADKLDYVIVRLEKEIGRMPFGINETGTDMGMVNPQFQSPMRSWIKILPNSLPLQPNSSFLFVAQHPDGKPMKFNVGQVIGVNAQNMRIRYNTNTEGGSSGSPCFNEKLELIALHNCGDPTRPNAPTYNQGIPIPRILDDLHSKGFDLVAKQTEWEGPAT